jgi:uroporphyrinogen-III synthase
MAEPLQGRFIAVTRPPEQAKKLIALIEQAGGQVIPYPLIMLSALDDYSLFAAQLDKLADYDWAIFISSNAVQYGMPRLLQRWAPVPGTLRFAAIGPATAAELKKFGIGDTLTPDNRYDSESLLVLPEMHNVASRKIMIFRGVGGREILGDTLKQRGAHVEFAECYRRTNPQTDIRALQTHWQKDELDAIVVTSSEAMRHLLQLGAASDWLSSIPLCVNHERVAELPRQHGMRVVVASAPGDEGMLDCILRTLA